MNNWNIKNYLSLILISTLISTFTEGNNNQQKKQPSFNSQQKTAIQRMGSTNIQLFDDNWIFSRFGLQPDGTSVAEPENQQNPELNDANWRKLDLPHDWAVEGPSRIELKGETGKLPYQGIGWYRKQFTMPAEDAGKRIFLDFDGAMVSMSEPGPMVTVHSVWS